MVFAYKGFSNHKSKVVWPIKGLVQVSPTKIGLAINSSPFYHVWLKKKDEALLSCLLHLSLVGYEPKTTLVLLIAMERRVDVQRSASEEKTAEEQLNDLVEAAGSGGLEPRPAEFLGGVTATTARSGDSSSGDLLKGLIPASSSGSVLEGMQPGVRRVEVVGLQGDRATTNVEGSASMPTGPPRSYGPERGVEGVLGCDGNVGTRWGEGGSQDGRQVSTTPYPSSLEDPVGNFGSAAPEVMVNPFWSPERRALERLHYGEFGFGSVGKRSIPETPPAYVEMDPIELFRLKCYREAEERFRAGLSGLGGGQRSPASFASVEEPSSESYPPKPPPGPPPASPPKMVDQGNFWKPPPPPPPPPLPSFPSWGNEYGTGGSSRNGLVGENPNETLRTFDLPRLDEEFSSLEFGDWLSMVDSQMGDISYTSSVWWGLVKGSVDQCYREWLQQGPIDRLRMKPVLDPRASQWPRTERRALAMLLHPETPICLI